MVASQNNLPFASPKLQDKAVIFLFIFFILHQTFLQVFFFFTFYRVLPASKIPWCFDLESPVCHKIWQKLARHSWNTLCPGIILQSVYLCTLQAVSKVITPSMVFLGLCVSNTGITRLSVVCYGHRFLVYCILQHSTGTGSRQKAAVLIVQD